MSKRMTDRVMDIVIDLVADLLRHSEQEDVEHHQDTVGRAREDGDEVLADISAMVVDGLVREVLLWWADKSNGIDCPGCPGHITMTNAQDHVRCLLDLGAEGANTSIGRSDAKKHIAGWLGEVRGEGSEPQRVAEMEAYEVYRKGVRVLFGEGDDFTGTPGTVVGRHVVTHYRVQLDDGMTLRLKGSDLNPAREDLCEGMDPKPLRKGQVLCIDCLAWNPPQGNGRGECRRNTPTPRIDRREPLWPSASWNDWCTQGKSSTLVVPEYDDRNHNARVTVEVELNRRDHTKLKCIVNGEVVGHVQADDLRVGSDWRLLSSLGETPVTAWTAGGQQLMVPVDPAEGTLLDYVLTVVNSAKAVDAGELVTGSIDYEED